MTATSQTPGRSAVAPQRSIRTESLRDGPRSAACFRQALNVATRAGICAGLVGELWRRKVRPSRGPVRQPCPVG